MFTYKLYSADTDITGHHLEKCPKRCPVSFAQCAASLIEDSEVWGSHIGGSEDLSLLGCDTVVTVLDHEGEGTTVRQNASGAASHFRRLESSSYSYQGIRDITFVGSSCGLCFGMANMRVSLWWIMVGLLWYSCIASSVQDFQAPDSIFLHFTFCQRLLKCVCKSLLIIMYIVVFSLTDLKNSMKMSQMAVKILYQLFCVFFNTPLSFFNIVLHLPHAVHACSVC